MHIEVYFENNPGSVSHYYDVISFGQIKVTGEYLPAIYEVPRESLYLDSFISLILAFFLKIIIIT